MNPQLGEQEGDGGADGNAAAPPPGAVLDVSFPASITELGPIRRRVRVWLQTHDLTTEERDDLLLVASELLTNAVESSPGPTAVVRLVARLDEPGRQRRPDGRMTLPQDGCIELRVTDEGPGFDLPPYEPVPPTQLRGRGLLLARALTDGVRVEQGDGGTTVVAHRWLAPRNVPVNAT